MKLIIESSELNEAISHAKEVASKVRKNGNYLHFRGNERIANECLECAAEHEQLAEWLTELQERREADRWIPVSERLPEYSDNYLVFVDDGYIDIGVYHSDKEEWSLCDAHGFYWAKDKGIGVIAWKPLPEPYKEGEDPYQRAKEESIPIGVE